MFPRACAAWLSIVPAALWWTFCGCTRKPWRATADGLVLVLAVPHPPPSWPLPECRSLACPPGRVPGARIPIAGRWPLPPPESAMPAFSLGACRAALIVSHSALYALHSSPVTGVPRFPSPLFLALIVYHSTASKVIHNGVCTYVSSKFRHFGVKNRSNGVKIGSKKVKKGAHFVMPILTFWVLTPSGASARADLACRKGFLGWYFGPKTARAKVVHNFRKGREKRERGTGNPPEAGRPGNREPASGISE